MSSREAEELTSSRDSVTSLLSDSRAPADPWGTGRRGAAQRARSQCYYLGPANGERLVEWSGHVSLSGLSVSTQRGAPRGWSSEGRIMGFERLFVSFPSEAD